MRSRFVPLAPAAILTLGVAGTGLLQPGTRLPLERPLATFPDRVAEFTLQEKIALDEGQLAVLRPDDYLLRRYSAPSGRRADLFVAFFGRQRSGSTIHSPRHCLPGSGWEPVRHERMPLRPGTGEGTINRYVVQHESGDRALVYYWYQGRGRVAANEYAVKLDLLRDAVVRRRTDEAVVRIVFPLPSDAELDYADPTNSSMEVVHAVADALWQHLPS